MSAFIRRIKMLTCRFSGKLTVKRVCSTLSEILGAIFLNKMNFETGKMSGGSWPQKLLLVTSKRDLYLYEKLKNCTRHWKNRNVIPKPQDNNLNWTSTVHVHVAAEVLRSRNNCSSKFRLRPQQQSEQWWASYFYEVAALRHFRYVDNLYS
jgi:hypothetical protein